MSGISRSATERKSSRTRIRRRPVSFGNPALGTYHGSVYTLQGHNVHASATTTSANKPLIEGAVSTERLVAMVDVPPEQVPEGILNLARSFRPWIDHVRIVIAEGTDKEEEIIATKLSTGEGEDESKQEITMYSMAPTPTASAMHAASILARDEQELLEQQHQGETTETRVSNGADHEMAGPPSRTYLVLFELCSEEAADQLVEELHQKPYTSLDETQVCDVYHVVALQGEDGVSLMSPFFAPATTKSSEGGLEIIPSASTDSTSPDTRNRSSGNQESIHKAATTVAKRTEDYNCAVCLERMDLDRPTTTERTSILTTVCNHSFHMDCLLQWQDFPCPVCRYDHSGLNEALSQCYICGTTEHNYVCLICGVVACGGGRAIASARPPTRPPPPSHEHNSEAVVDCRSDDTIETAASSRVSSTSHARQHYDETLHAYALDTETQHVWDHAGQGFVHRLLQNKDDGKLVEVSDPNNTTSQERTLSPGLSDAQEGEVVHRKLEGFASQFHTLLKSQMEQQRIYYEGRLEEIRREYEDTGTKPRKRTADLIAALKQERHQLSQRLVTLQGRRNKVRDDVSFLISMNESLEANKTALKRQVEEAQEQRLEARKMFEECLPPLQEKVTRLMLQLEGENGQGEQADNNDKKPAARRK